jgi:diguanylate cyclase (GGDEF)-like protein
VTGSTAAWDPLTGLYDRRAFVEALEQAVERDQTVTVGLVDTDHFGALNHTHGHEVGDRVLAELGARLQALAAAAGGFAGRLGGDEFSVALPGVPLEAGFLQLERLRTAVAADAVTDHRLTVSVGVANYPRDARTAPALLKRADQALWQAKAAGRDQVALPAAEEMVLKSCYYSPAQVGRLRKLAEAKGQKEAVLMREALDDLLLKYDVK